VANLSAALLIVGGLTLIVSFTRHAAHDSLAPVRALLSVALLVIGAASIMRGPLRPFHGPNLVLIAAIGSSYGAVAGGIGLAFPVQTPRLVQGALGTLCVTAGVLLLLFAYRVIKL
jgi:hypothetical protein